jgi:hypothetical protein
MSVAAALVSLLTSTGTAAGLGTTADFGAIEAADRALAALFAPQAEAGGSSAPEAGAGAVDPAPEPDLASAAPAPIRADVASDVSPEPAPVRAPVQLALALDVPTAPAAATPTAAAEPSAPVQLAFALETVSAAQDAPQADDQSGTDASVAGPPAPPPNERAAPPPTPQEQEPVEGRRRPDDHSVLPEPVRQENPGAIRSPPPEAFPSDHVPIPDRWRLIQTLGIVRERWWDPYHQNTLKGDRPICYPENRSEEHQRTLGCRFARALGLEGHDWFLSLTGISDTVIEPRSFPTPALFILNPGENDLLGRGNSIAAVQTFIFSASLIKGSTTYRPPDVEWRLTLAAQANYVDVPVRRILNIRPSRDSNRFDYALGVQEAFLDYHIKNTSYRYDFYSIRVGIQPWQEDFRGFLFNDNQLGIRLFMNRDNNRWQFNFAAFWRLEKDTNSGLNNLFQTPRDDWVLTANVYRQDFPVLNVTSTASVTWNINREKNQVELDDNGFPARPAVIGNIRSRSYDAVYLGYGMDGHFNRLNITAQVYGLFGQDRDNTFTSRPARISAFFAAAEPSYDFNWIRVRGSALYASGDGNPFDNVQHGFDAIFENPIFAGADTSYWVRQTIPFVGGARAVALNGRNGILNSLRSSKEQGQSNFVNPGTMLLGVGADFDILPQLRLSTNLNHLWFENTTVLERLRQQCCIRRDIGWDASAAIIYRPFMTQNIIFRLSGALLQPGRGFRDLFTTETRDKRYYSVLFNATLTY